MQLLKYLRSLLHKKTPLSDACLTRELDLLAECVAEHSGWATELSIQTDRSAEALYLALGQELSREEFRKASALIEDALRRPNLSPYDRAIALALEIVVIQVGLRHGSIPEIDAAV